MNSNNKIANIILLIVILVPTLCFVLLHSTSKMAVRTKFLFDGHPIIALTSPITTNEDEDFTYYTFTKLKKPVITASGTTYISNFRVNKKVFLYFANNYNPGV
ncbi:hypothetical protein V7056_19290 [Bacillus sp. JJ664]